MAKAKDKKKNIEKTEKTEKNENVNENVNIQKTEANVSVNVKNNSSTWIMAIIFGVMVIIALAYGYNNVLSKQMLERGCSELSKSPDLKYPTVCVPLDVDSNRGDYVDQKSDPMCRCKVDTGNGTSTVIDIRLAK